MFHPNHIESIVLDLASISEEWSEKKERNFLEFLRVLHERDYKIYLTIANPNATLDFPTEYILLKGRAKTLLTENPVLEQKESFWISNDETLQSALQEKSLYFAGSVDSTREHGGMQYQHLYDLLGSFHPSQNTARELADDLVKIKNNAPQVPLLIGIGGQDECGHAFFAGELTDALQDKALLVAGLDLIELMGHEFQNKAAPEHYWRSSQIRKWVMNELLIPYTQGKTIFVEEAPACLGDYEATAFPLFLPPDAVLVLWGTVPFIPELQELLDVRILLDLDVKTAAARILALDEREDFDPKFVETYEKTEGRSYASYLKRFEVQDEMDYMINFNNFHAFRFSVK